MAEVLTDMTALVNSLPAARRKWEEASPFEHVVIDDFFSNTVAHALSEEFPNPNLTKLPTSRDYIFAEGKYEKSGFQVFGPTSLMVYEFILTQEFSDIISMICGNPITLDDSFHGGGMHQSGRGAFLDMHADYNVHPIKKRLRREINVLIYLTPDWRPEWGGELLLRNRETGEESSVAPLFNRCVIMRSSANTLHGFRQLQCPDGIFRRSLAAYGYSVMDDSDDELYRATTWYPEGSALKRIVGRSWPHLVRVKNRFFGSSTSKNV